MADSPRQEHSLDAGVSPVSAATSRYAYQLDEFEAYFEAGDLMTLAFEDLISRQDEVMGEVYDFLGLEPHALSNTHSNVAGGKRQLANWWYELSKSKWCNALAKALVPGPIRSRLKNHVTKKPSPVSGRFEFTQEEEAQILSGLRPDIERLRERYGVSSDVWGL